MAFGASSASAATKTVTNGGSPNIQSRTSATYDPSQWSTAAETLTTTGSVQLVDGPTTPPLGTGSAQLKTGTYPAATPADGKTYLLSPNLTGTRLRLLDQLEYSTFTAAFPTPQEVTPVLAMEIDFNGPAVAGGFATLTMDPVYYQDFGGAGDSNIQEDNWQHWDALSEDAKWSSSRDLRPANGGPASDICKPDDVSVPGAPNCNYFTWERVRQQLPDATLQFKNIYSSVGSASGPAALFQNFTGNVDEFKIGINRSFDTYDFELNPPTGPTGPQGIPGSQGGSGGQGDPGSQGGQGGSGATGGQGPAGSNGTNGLTPSGTTIATKKVVVASKSLKVSAKSRKSVVQVTCPRSNGLCEGVVKFVYRGKVIARQTFLVRGARSGKVTLKLSKATIKKLGKSKRVKVDVFSRDATGAASSTSKTVTLKTAK